jgi:ATP-dependent DNA helicase RecG
MNAIYHHCSSRSYCKPLCHRSYSNPGGAVRIAIFDNRLEIWNDGGLPFGLTPSDLKKDHLSHPRNPLIASVLYYRGLIEKWGRGTQKIVSLCVQAGLPEPEFLEQHATVGVRFFPCEYVAPAQISHDFSERHRAILKILSKAKGAGMSLSEISRELTLPPSNRTLREDCQYLKKLGLVALHAAGPRTKWFLITNS